MGRPARVLDGDLVEQLRSHMSERGQTLTDIALAVGVDKSTLSRSLKDGSFSRSLRGALATLVHGDDSKLTTAQMLHKSLRILRVSDRMRQDAERMIAEALDRIGKNK